MPLKMNEEERKELRFYIRTLIAASNLHAMLANPNVVSTEDGEIASLAVKHADDLLIELDRDVP